ncbi:hypothetical protein ABZ143_002782 [Listeria monocytogenes]
MGIFNKARKKVEGTFDEDTLKQDVSSGALEKGSILWGVRAMVIGTKSVLNEVIGRTVSVANNERDKIINKQELQKPQKQEEVQPIEAPQPQTSEMSELEEFEEWKKFQAMKRGGSK